MMRIRYLLTVWTAEAADEHRVLGDVLRLLATSAEVPAAHLVGDLAELGTSVELSLGSEDAMRTGDLWGPLGVTPRANLELVVTMPARRPVERVVSLPPTEVHATVVDPPPARGEARLVVAATGADRGAPERWVAGRRRSVMQTGNQRCASTCSPP